MDASSMPATTKKVFAEKLTLEGNLVLLPDGTEQNIPGPVNGEDKQENYSGKKKKYTLKNGLMVGTMSLILFVGAIVSGVTDDKK